MNYELAKELKDAGFPQSNNTLARLNNQGEWEEIPKIPTLSELIEACGDSFVYVARRDAGDGMNWRHWTAANRENEKGMGTTPEIAVARLWLALNKKDG